MRDERVAEIYLGLPVVLDQQVGLADGVVGRRHLLPMHGDVLIHIGPVVNGEMPFGDGDVEQVHHEADHLARGEVFPGFLAALLREPSQQFLVDVTHLQRRQGVGAELQLSVLVEDWSQPVMLRHLPNGGPVVEMLDDVVDVAGKPIDVGAEVFFEQDRVLLKHSAQSPIGPVGEGCGTHLHALYEPGKLCFGDFGPVGQDFGCLVLSPRHQNALEAADYDDGQDDVLVLVGLEFAAQAFCRLPDFVGKVVQLGFVQG